LFLDREARYSRACSTVAGPAVEGTSNPLLRATVLDMPWEDYKLFVNDNLKYSANKHEPTTVHDGPSVPGRNARWHRSNDDKLKMISEMGKMKLIDPDNIEAQTLFRAFVLKLAQDVSSYETVTSRLKSWDPQSNDTKFVSKALKEVWEDDVKVVIRFMPFSEYG